MISINESIVSNITLLLFFGRLNKSQYFFKITYSKIKQIVSSSEIIQKQVLLFLYVNFFNKEFLEPEFNSLIGNFIVIQL